MSEITLANVNDLKEVIRAEVRQAVGEALRDRQLPVLLSLQEAAELLGVSQTTMYRAAKIQGFPVTHDFGHAKVVTDQLLEWIKKRSNYDLVYNFSG
ncbi:excision promoter [Bacillus sp. OxB-1]|uniref:helix-turn-helix domain-containing protein n=1 Tax=Bacillus sp. (strain OxB-1) TaxID=98228 RepID=UPI0005822148|nr:helix-turn-helix domain-containing protein [Bacillus sp. OxB-1]BAQ11354.1 excision promoter [Bacillus sp. OxB-1]